ncbi:MAG: allophanate hydrolase subunit 1, partial [Gemmataceae bacterium]|nr:allophanate hydrolase subunit 1 [Gemmataceae bacterium]
MLTLSYLGDQAVVAQFRLEADALAFAHALRQAHWPEVVDIVPAYTRVAVFFHPGRTRIDQFRQRLAEFLPLCTSSNFTGTLHEIPCCYELGPDLAVVANATRLTSAEVIDFHTSIEYTVYAIGFTPGFPYLGYLPPPLCGVPRRATPRLRVPPGSVGLTGRQ